MSKQNSEDLLEALALDAEDEDIVIISDDGNTFDVTTEKNPRYDLYSINKPRPTEQFREPIYERQPGESLADYRKFLTYAAIPPDDRSAAMAWRKWRELNGKDPTTYITHNFSNVAVHWRWADRAFMIDMRRNEIAERIWIERDVARREADWSAAQELREKGLSSLQNIDDDMLGPNSIAKFLKLASDLQKDAVPSANLNEKTLSNIMDSLPEDRRGKVLEIVMARISDS